MPGHPTASCRSCGTKGLEVFLSLGDLPLADGFVAEADLARPDERFPLDVALCPSCSLVQLAEALPPERLFGRDYLYFSSYSDTLLDHSRRHALRLISERDLGPRHLVVELASNDGYLLQYFAARGIPVLGIDPAPGPAEVAERRGVPTLREFFGLEVARRLRRESGAADVILANNVLAHVRDLNGFVAGMAELLADDGMVAIEVPYVRDLVQKDEFDTIYHEHLCYFSVSSLVPLFARHGLVLDRVETLPIHGGSIRLRVVRRARPDGSVERHLADEAKSGLATISAYRDFARRVESLRAELRRLLDDLRTGGKRLAGYGAPAKGTILLNYVGTDAGEIEFVVDRNVHKQGRWVPGVRIPIRSPDRLLETMPDCAILLPWNFQAEILAQQSEYRRRGGRFLIPIPRPMIV